MGGGSRTRLDVQARSGRTAACVNAGFPGSLNRKEKPVSETPSAELDPSGVGYRVQVAYTVPVEVIVDLKKEKVDRVIVVDEMVGLDHGEGVRRETTLSAVPKELAERAVEIAEGAEFPGWPAWDFGF